MCKSIFWSIEGKRAGDKRGEDEKGGVGSQVSAKSSKVEVMIEDG